MGYNVAACTAIGLLLPILACIGFAMRTHCQRRYSQGLSIDDILIIPAFVLVVTAGVAFVYGSQTAIIGGHSLPALTETEYAKLNKFEYIFWIGHVVTISLIKLSILFFFRRIFKGRTERTAFDIANWTLIGLTIAWTITFFFADIFVCGKYPQALWTTNFWQSNACINTFALNLAACALNWLLDLAILIEPLVMIQSLQLVSTKKRLQASAVFLISIFAVIAALLRMIVWAQVNAGGHHATEYTFLGVTYPVMDLEAIVTVPLFWTYVEMGVGFIVACLLPSARVFDAITPAKIIEKMKLISSSVSLRSKRSESESASTTQMDKNSFQHYDREMVSIDNVDKQDV